MPTWLWIVVVACPACRGETTVGWSGVRAALSSSLCAASAVRAHPLRSRGQRLASFFIPAETFAEVEWVEGDILDVISLDQAMQCADTVIHAAFHDRPRRDLEAAHELEVLGTRALFRAVADDARRAGTVENVVVVGTTLAYGKRNSRFASGWSALSQRTTVGRRYVLPSNVTNRGPLRCRAVTSIAPGVASPASI